MKSHYKINDGLFLNCESWKVIKKKKKGATEEHKGFSLSKTPVPVYSSKTADE